MSSILPPTAGERSDDQNGAPGFDPIQDLAQSLELTPQSIEERLELMGLTHAARRSLAEVAGAVDAGADAFIDQLYTHLLATPSTARWFQRPGSVERLKRQQRAYLTELFTAPIDWGYVLRRLQIGMVHHRVRLTPRWYLATCSHFVCGHLSVLLDTAGSPREGVERVVTLMQSVLFDVSLVLDAYGMSLERTLVAEQASAAESQGRPGLDGRPGGDEWEAESGPPPILSRLHLTDENCDERMGFLELDESALRLLRETTPIMRLALPEMLDGFYGVFRRWPSTRSLLPDEVVERLVKQVASYWMELAEGDFGRTYAASRTRIGVVHERIGVTAPVYLTGLARQIGSLLRCVASHWTNPGPHLASIVKAVFYDASFVLDAYMDARASTVLRHEGYAGQLLASLTVGVAVLDSQHRVRYSNSALLQQLGVDAGIVRHMRAGDLLPDARIHPLLSEVAQNRGLKRMLRLDYGGRTLRVTLLQLGLGLDKASEGPLAILVEDLTEAASAPTQVRQLERGLEAVVHAVDVVLWEADSRDWIITMVSSPVLSLTGYREVFFLGRPGAWPGLIPAPDRERFLAECGQLSPGQKFTVIHRLITADGTQRWVRTHVTRSGERTEAFLLRGVSLDVSVTFQEEQRRLEAVGRLAGSIAHEMNGVLALISGSLGLIADSQVPEQSTEIQAVGKAVQRGASLTRRLQIFAQGAPLRPLPTPLNDIIHSSMPDLRVAAGPASELQFHPDPHLGLCSIDPTLFAGALINLVANARESMVNGGPIVLATRNVPANEIDLAADVGSFADHVEVSVNDAGSGMDDEVRARATEPCFSTKSDAAGLGLSTVYGFVHQSRGHLVIESREGLGSTVRLRFPRLVDSMPKETQTAASTGAPRPLLVVDDDQALAGLLRRVLERQGFVVEVVHLPDDARKAVAAKRPRAVLCDVVFHGQPLGAELGRELRRVHPDVPVIYMSGFTKASLSLGPDDYFIAKPFNLKELYALLEQVLK